MVNEMRMACPHCGEPDQIIGNDCEACGKAVDSYNRHEDQFDLLGQAQGQAQGQASQEEQSEPEK